MKLILVIDDFDISCEIPFRWMSLDHTHDKSSLLQVIAWCLLLHIFVKIHLEAIIRSTWPVTVMAKNWQQHPRCTLSCQAMQLCGSIFCLECSLGSVSWLHAKSTKENFTGNIALRVMMDSNYILFKLPLLIKLHHFWGPFCLLI